ncbi:hypothetical protein E2P71_06500 [Candidatus Bathyarchaeota archaeon]|nr:hypothetical protein E2P71_06500 [Candidatus Bathyarchaeota archaeon]
MVSSNQMVRIANIIGFLTVIIVNGAANALPLNGVTTAELSDKYGNLFTPAGYVFAIWGVIYLLLAAFSYYQYRAEDELHEKIGWYFVLSCIFNSVWIFLWHYEYIALSVFAMTGLLFSLIMIYQRLDIGQTIVPRDRLIMVNTTFSVYLGWITVAPIANVAALLVALGWDAYNITAIYITAALILIALLLGVIYIYTRGDIAYAAVLIWALIGIAVKQMNTWLLPYVAGFSVVIMVVVIILKKMGKLG